MKFPLQFEVQANAGSGMGTQWAAQSDQLPPIPCAIPPDFGGPGGGYSPEDLFAIALLNCLIATFKVYCEKSKAGFKEVKSRAVLSVDKVVNSSGLVMSQVEIFFDIDGASDKDQVRKLMEAAIRDCAISNSIKSGKTFHINIS